jgi:hypothetical protein
MNENGDSEYITVHTRRNTETTRFCHKWRALPYRAITLAVINLFLYVQSPYSDY